MKLRTAIITVMLAASFGAAGQTVSSYDYILGTNPYLNSGNAAYLGLMPASRISYAQLSGEKKDGYLTPISDSHNAVFGKAATETYMVLSDRIAFYGKLSFDYNYGRDMTGQILMNPDYNPVNFLEDTDADPGVKTREFYALAGALSYSFNEHWALGIRFAYDCGNQTKRKDPRFRNSWMDLNLSAGVRWSPSEKMSFGLSALFRNTIEQIKGQVFGYAPTPYLIFTDKGGFFGTTAELGGDENYLPTTDTRPMVNHFYGGALRFDFTGSTRSFNELSFRWRDGYYGSYASSKPLFFEFSGLTAGYDGSMLFGSDKALSKVSINAALSMLNNSENTLKYTTIPGKNTVVEKVAQNKILGQTDLDAGLGYLFMGGVSGNLPAYEIGARADFFMRSQNTTIYPYSRKHSYGNVDATLYGGWNIRKGADVFRPGASVDFFTGFGTAAEDGNTGGASTSLKSADLWLYRQFEYDTASHAGASLSFRYTHSFTKIDLYVEVSDYFASMLRQPEYLQGRFRNETVITIGCSF